jgi:hypothetical protein
VEEAGEIGEDSPNGATAEPKEGAERGTLCLLYQKNNY